MTEWTTIRISKNAKKLLKEKGKGDDYNEKLLFLMDEDKFSKTFITEEEARKIVEEEIKKVSSY